MSDGGISSSEVTATPVSNVAPRAVASSIIARLISPVPPSATGQPSACAEAPRASGIDEDRTPENGRNVWAAAPANRPLASGVSHRRARAGTGSAAYAPNLARWTGWCGRRTTGWRMSAESAVEPLGQRPEQALPGAAVRSRGPPPWSSTDRQTAATAAAVERMTELHLGPAPDQAGAREVELLRERRADRQRMDRGALVVHEAGQRELARPGAAAEPVGRLQHRDVDAGRSEGEGGGEAVGATADDGGCRHSASMPIGFPWAARYCRGVIPNHRRHERLSVLCSAYPSNPATWLRCNMGSAR